METEKEYDTDDEQADLRSLKDPEKSDPDSSFDQNIINHARNPRPDPVAPKRSKKWHILLLISAFIPLAIGVYCFKNETAGNIIPAKDYYLEITKYIKGWKNNYPSQSHDTWCSIAGHMEEFATGSHPSPLVFVLAYNEAVRTTELLASDIARAALELKYDNDKCGDSNLAKLHGSDRGIKKGYLLEEYLSQIKDCKKMIMYNLEELDTSAAQDLHSLLDPDYPNIRNAVYIFTVQVLNDRDNNVYHQVLNTLRNRWGPKMEDDKLNPLFSRLVNNLRIIPEPVFES